MDRLLNLINKCLHFENSLIKCILIRIVCYKINYQCANLKVLIIEMKFNFRFNGFTHAYFRSFYNMCLFLWFLMILGFTRFP